MREDVRGRHSQAQEFDALRVKQNQIGEHLPRDHDFDVPDALVEEELANRCQNYARSSLRKVSTSRSGARLNKISEDFSPRGGQGA